MGLDYVAAVLTHLSQGYGEDRYRVSPWLQARAREVSHG
ncbi:hypothetical protein [Pseudoxanthomonas winnipegensis]